MVHQGNIKFCNNLDAPFKLSTGSKELPMYARNVSINLKPDSAKQFTQKLEQDIVPLLKRQEGFQDEITLLADGGKYAIAISLWDRKESAEAYSRETYPQVLKGLAKVVDGTPEVQAYEVANSTCHKIAAQS